MKKRLLKAGFCLLAVLLTGAVAVTTVDKLVIAPLTVDSLGGVVEKYLEFRTQMGPIVPPGVMYQDVAERMAKGDWSFLNENWFFTFADGTLYVSDKSELAKKLKLPVRIQLREDLKTGQIYIFSAPVTDGKAESFTGLAVFSAPEFMPYEKDFPLETYLFDELSPRRVVWEITLKPEADAWRDLVLNTQSATASTEFVAEGGAMAMMSVPPEQSTNIWLYLDAQDQTISLNVFAPEGFTNRVEIYTCTDLVSGVWSVAQQDLYPSGTNPAVWDVTSDISNRFFRAGNMDIDSDGDGLPDAREQIVYRSNPALTDTDGDGLDDGTEVLTYGTNPASSDTDNDGMPDGWEVEHGLNPLLNDGLEDPDGDLFSNLHEYLIDTDPQCDMSLVETLIFDEDTSTLDGFNDSSLITNASLAYQGTNCIGFTLLSAPYHYYPRVDIEDATFGNSDALEFYIRSASGVNTNALRVRVYYSSTSEMSYPVDIRPYLYDSNGVPSSGITETYKKASIPVDVLRQGGSNTVGTIRHLRLEILPSEWSGYPWPQTFYVDRISLQDKSGMTSENLNVLSDHYLEITSGDQLDPISLRDPANHTVVRQSDGSPVAVTDVGLRSWVTDFNGTAGSPVVKHYVYVKLADALEDGQTYTYSNSVQDISGNYPKQEAISFTVTNAVPTSSIKVNQVGWLPEATKIAYVGNYLGDMGAMPLDTNVSMTATIRNADTGEAVYSTQLVKAVESDWINIGSTNSPFMIPFSGEEVWRINFTPLQNPGTYYVDVPGVGTSYRFQIGSNVYANAYYDCMRSLWYQRSGISMTNPAVSGIWTRQGDLQQNTNTAFYHNSVYDKSSLLYAGEEIGGYADFTGGWYDAADYDKYTKSAADAVNLLLTMYEIKPERFADNQLNLPESGNGIPDMLDEAKWELDWIAKMVSANGAAFNKCTYETWPNGMPSNQTAKMWVTLKTTRDTAAACAILAKAARIFAPYDSTTATLYSNKATLAWQCLTNHPDSYPIPPTSNWDDYNNPPGTNWVSGGVTNVIPGIHTGNYFSTNDVTYRLWAATEMYRLTESIAMHEEFSNIVYRAKGTSSATNFLKSVVGDESWQGNANSMILMYDYITLTNGLPADEAWRTAMKDQFISTVSNYWKVCDMDLPYDFEIKSHSILQWGEGAQIRRPYGYILTYELTGNDWFLGEALKNIDWPLGANPLSQTYITGIGSKYPMQPHNKIDHYDGIDEPIPGYNIYGLAWELEYNDYYKAIIDDSYPPYQYNPTNSLQYPLVRKHVDVWESVKHGEFVVDDLARTAMVLGYFSSTNAP